MKKVLSLFLITALTLALFTACGNAGTPQAPIPTPVHVQPAPPITQETNANILVGTWRDDTISIFTRIFNADGTGSRNTDERDWDEAENTPFEWEISTDGRLAITYTGGADNRTEYYDFVIDENTLTLYDEFHGISYIRDDSLAAYASQPINNDHLSNMDSGGLNISNEARTIAVQTLEITDDFLHGEITIDEAVEKLGELNEIDWLFGEDGDLQIDFAIFAIVLDMQFSSNFVEPTDEDIESIISSRNALAEILDMPRQYEFIR